MVYWFQMPLLHNKVFFTSHTKNRKGKPLKILCDRPETGPLKERLILRPFHRNYDNFYAWRTLKFGRKKMYIFSQLIRIKVQIKAMKCVVNWISTLNVRDAYLLNVDSRSCYAYYMKCIVMLNAITRSIILMKCDIDICNYLYKFL